MLRLVCHDRKLDAIRSADRSAERQPDPDGHRILRHDQGIAAQDQVIVLQTALWMLGISALRTIFAVGNTVFSVQVGESVARDLRDALFVRIQAFSYGDLDRQKTGQLMVRRSSDTSALQRLTQVSLRIGTRTPMLMIGSLFLMIRTAPGLALTMVPLLLVTLAGVVFLAVKMELLPTRTF
jgi:ATP-binding cassette subfamily B multidrug efflux pump